MTTYPDAFIQSLEEKARLLRIDCLKMIYKRQAGHPGGSLSAAEIITALFFHTLRLDPTQPNWADRDRFILSKGHASALLYAALARRGFFPQDDLENWGELSCHLQGHPDRLKTPGVDMTTGILGHGIPVGAGLALAARLQHLDYHVFTLLGDGECQAGIVWEGAATCAKYHLSNLTAIVDYNDVQLDGPVHEVMPIEPLRDKWLSYRWAVLEINGHNLLQVLEALDTAREIHNQPVVILAHTTKGKGVSFMENQAYWHGNAPNAAQFAQAMQELGQEGK